MLGVKHSGSVIGKLLHFKISHSVFQSQAIRIFTRNKGLNATQGCLACNPHGSKRFFSNLPPFTVFEMPALSPTMESGTITGWKIKAGDRFSAGDVLCEVETDKATVSYELQDEGVLAKILVKEGTSEIKVGQAVAIAVESLDIYKEFIKADEKGLIQVNGTPDADSVSSTVDVVAASPATPTSDLSEARLLSPAARFLAHSKGLDATGLPGTGKGGRVTKADVVKAINNGVPLPALPKQPKKALSAPVPAPVFSSSAPSPEVVFSEPQVAPLEAESSGALFEDIPASNMRKVIGKRLTESKATVPHSYLAVEVELDEVMKLRKLFAKDAVKISVNDLVIRSAGLALRDCPQVNSKWNGKEVVHSNSVDISVAVATPNGLITPIVPDVDKKGLSEITEKVKDLASRARANKLAPEEFMGGSFTISNLGMFGINEFSAVINPPQAAILAVGGGSKKVLPAPFVEGEEIQKPRVATVMTAKLSYDRRVVNEAEAAQFMTIFKHYLSTPKVLMM